MGYIERDVGRFPVSVGTSLALEGLLGVHPNQPRQPSGYKAIRSLWINLRTMIRNLHSSIPSEKAKLIDPTSAVMVLMDEIRVIPEVLRQHDWSSEVVFYYSDLDELKWIFPGAEWKKIKTEKQALYNEYERMVLAKLLAHLREEGMPVQSIKRNPPQVPVAAAIITHYPHELLWKPLFERLFLLESHTGKLKAYNNWHTKLNGISDDINMPFNQYTIQVFGEKNLFDSQPKAIRDELKQLAEYKRWTAITTFAKMKGDLAALGSEGLKKNFARLMP